VGRIRPGYECLIFFFTDDEAPRPAAALESSPAKRNPNVVGYGSVKEQEFEGLTTGGGQMTIGQTIDDVQQAFKAIAAAD
jgi:hypothetical protein